ncbi:MAG: hypothetical protein K0S56_4283 [Microvirga sp.]|nr:hypothetical protein [Microvirga sp.]
MKRRNHFDYLRWSKFGPATTDQAEDGRVQFAERDLIHSALSGEPLQSTTKSRLGYYSSMTSTLRPSDFSAESATPR